MSATKVNTQRNQRGHSARCAAPQDERPAALSALPDARDSKLKTVQHLKHLCVENGGKGKD